MNASEEAHSQTEVSVHNRLSPLIEPSWNISEEDYIRELIKADNGQWSWDISEEQFLRELISQNEGSSC